MLQKLSLRSIVSLCKALFGRARSAFEVVPQKSGPQRGLKLLRVGNQFVAARTQQVCSAQEA